MIRFAFVAALMVLASSSLSAHDWYPWTCCSDHDCHPLAPGELHRTVAGWLTPRGALVPFEDARIKATPRDHPGVHLCERTDGSVICLYLPETEQ